MDATSDLKEVAGIGQQLELSFSRLGIRTVDDLVQYFPRRYDDFSNIQAIKSIRPGQVTLEVTFGPVSGRYLRYGRHMCEALASDNTGSVRLVWFNQPYRLTSLKKDQLYYVSGKYELRYQRLSIINPVVEAKSDFPVNTARIVPRYAVTKGLTSSEIRRSIKKLDTFIRNIPEQLPLEIVDRYKLIPLSQALGSIHFPSSSKDLESARRRLAFDEVFKMVLASELNKLAHQHDKSMAINFDENLAKSFVSKLPFTLTDDQRKAIWQIYKDMAKSRPMNRLIEGDVGSGKTAVAAMAGLMAINSGHQAVLMAPTELLAKQHYETVTRMFTPIGLENKVGLLIGSLSQDAKTKTHGDIESNKLMFVIGTHALIQEKVKMPDLALIVIDEQHRFGVNQRQALKLKASKQPHLLALSATPIPRSLALTLFGELAISRLIEKPKDRPPLKTKLVKESALERELDFVKDNLIAGQQLFVVCPSIDTDPKYSVNEVFKWAEDKFKGFKVGLVHGKLKPEDKSRVMQQFVEHRLDILVATTVIEVGIDVPNATMMIVFDSDNFGLAQLHQLRGRVGRGSLEGYCYYVYSDSRRPSDRLKALETSTDGFELAELDLSIRGPGAIYGKLQHGLLDLKVAEIDDVELISDARSAALFFMQSGLSLLKYKQLRSDVNKLQKLTFLN